MTYSYLCTEPACQHTWEADHPMSAAPLTECPKCGGGHAKRLISGAPKFVLMGGGWAADNYSKKPATS